MRVIPQEQWMSQFNDKYRAKFNPKLFERKDEDIIREMSNVIYSCQVNRFFTLKVLNIEVIKDYESICKTLQAHFEKKRSKTNKDDNPYQYIPINDSKIMLMKVTYFIQKNGVERMKVNGRDQDVVNPHTILEVLIKLPRFVDKYYFQLAGNKYNAIYQIVDGSTYNNSTANSSKFDNVTMKTMFGANRLNRTFKTYVDVNTKDKINCICYVSVLFNVYCDAMYFLLANYGLYSVLDIFHASKYIYVTKEPSHFRDWYCFKKHDLYVNVFKPAFEEHTIQALVSAIIDGIDGDATVDSIFSRYYWLMILGHSYGSKTVERGIYECDALESIYDITTRETLHLPPQDKKDIYRILKWMICQFPELRAKENTDVSVKRIRIAEYIAHIYAIKLTTGIHRISELGPKVKMKNIISAINTKPDYVIGKVISLSNLISYVDLPNDNDALLVLKCTFKGISGLGENGQRVQPAYRLVDPSHIGIIDLDTSSASDPGMTGMLCPMCNIEEGYGGKSFTDYKEPNDWEEKSVPRLAEYEKLRGHASDVNPFIYKDGYTPMPRYNHYKDDMEAKVYNTVTDENRCPFIFFDDSHLAGQQPTISEINRENPDVNLADLFTINPDNEVKEELEPTNENNHYDDYRPFMI